MSQDAARGALPALRAATGLDAAAGSYYAPDGIFQAKGDPVLIPIPKPAEDAAAARRLWEISEDLTGMEFKSAGSTAGASRYATGSLEEDWRARSLSTKRSEG